MKHDLDLEGIRRTLGIAPDATLKDCADNADALMKLCGAHVREVMDFGFYDVIVTWDVYELRDRSVSSFEEAMLHVFQQFTAIYVMRGDGMSVTLDQKPSHDYRVRVKGPGLKTMTTTSTSGYPILSAFEKYQAWKDASR